MRNALAVALLSLAACSDTTPTFAPEPRDLPLAQDGSVARRVIGAPDRVRVELDLANVRAALQAWKASGEHSSPPSTLEELKVEGLNYRADLDYDPVGGTVSSRAYPGL